MTFSIIYVSESGTFNITLILPVVNSGNLTIKAIGNYPYLTTGPLATVNFKVTKGLDTLFEELESLREALNQTDGESQYNEDQSSTEETADGTDEGTQANIDTELSESAESLLFEIRAFAQIAIALAIVASVLSLITLFKRT